MQLKMMEKLTKNTGDSPKIKNRIGCRLNESQARQWHEMLTESGKKDADLLKSILFKKTLIVKQVNNSTENLIIEVSRMVTELRSISRKMSIEESQKKNYIDNKMAGQVEKLLQETEQINEKIFQQWWQDTQ